LGLFVAVVKVIGLPRMIVVEEGLLIRRVLPGRLVRYRFDLNVSTAISVRRGVRR
jgi:hypothetical protein